MTPAKLRQLLLDNNLLESGERVIVGLSGGPDSVALLCLLCECELDLTILPVYIDHGLRPLEIPQEKKIVKDLAERFGLQYQTAKVNTLEHREIFGNSLEESARLLRYEALQKACSGFNASLIAIAHTADDQAEEILLRLLRGSGLKGLSGMTMKNNNIIRPLLTTPKDDLLHYLAKNKIPYCSDSSNSDRTFLRNRIRHDLLPAIAGDINPSIRSTLLRTAEILQEDENFLDDYVQQKIPSCLQNDAGDNSKKLNLSVFNKEHLAIKRRLIEKVLWQFSSRPSFKHIENILALSQHGNCGCELHLPQGVRVYKSRQDLCFSQPYGKASLRGAIKPAEMQPVEVEKGKNYMVEALNRELRIEYLSAPPPEPEEGALLVDGSNLVWPLILRSHRSGESFSPQGMKGRKTVSRFLSDQKIPRRSRTQHPVLISNGNIVAVLGLRIENEYAITDATNEYVLIRWLAQEKK